MERTLISPKHDIYWTLILQKATKLGFVAEYIIAAFIARIQCTSNKHSNMIYCL